MIIKKMKKNRKGYTLTELIVVVAILGILAAIATPMVINQIQTSRVNADVASGKAIEAAVQLCLADGTLKFDTITSSGTSTVTGNKIILGTVIGTNNTIPLAVKEKLVGKEYPSIQSASGHKWLLDILNGSVSHSVSTAASATNIELT